MKTISDFNFKNKKVLLRVDLNSDVISLINKGKNKVVESKRIKSSSETIKELKKQKAKIIILAHQGRPGKKDFVSLKQHARFLNKYVKVKFISDILGKNAVNEIKKLKSGEVILLENIRFIEDEFKPDKKNNKIIKILIPLVDFYINDAFSVCHRNQTSIIKIPKYLPHCAGRLLEKEVKSLKKIKNKSSLFILGGAKPEDNLRLINSLKKKKIKILTGGLFGQLCLISQGFNFGAQNEYLKDKIDIINKSKKIIKYFLNSKKIMTPIDFAVKIKKSRKEISINDFPSNYEIYDIGEKTIKSYINEIKKSKSIFMKGPVGECVDNNFCKGTFEILNAISKNKGFSLIGGGHLNDAVKKSRISLKKFSHISLSGGALARYIAGEKLPGIEVLN